MYFYLDDTTFTNIHKNKILSLIIDISENKKQKSTEEDLSTIILTQVLTMFTNLQYLKMGPTLCWHQRLSFKNSHPPVISSTLLELHVSVMTFTDCLYLLDGRFKQLHTLHVNTLTMPSDSLIINNEVDYFCLILCWNNYLF